MSTPPRQLAPALQSKLMDVLEHSPEPAVGIHAGAALRLFMMEDWLHLVLVSAPSEETARLRAEIERELKSLPATIRDIKRLYKTGGRKDYQRILEVCARLDMPGPDQMLLRTKELREWLAGLHQMPSAAAPAAPEDGVRMEGPKVILPEWPTVQ